nr:hypothetical protein BgiMline_025625 [Biomphalaria glabrata]
MATDNNERITDVNLFSSAAKKVVNKTKRVRVNEVEVALLFLITGKNLEAAAADYPNSHITLHVVTKR